MRFYRRPNAQRLSVACLLARRNAREEDGFAAALTKCYEAFGMMEGKREYTETVEKIEHRKFETAFTNTD